MSIGLRVNFFTYYYNENVFSGVYFILVKIQPFTVFVIIIFRLVYKIRSHNMTVTCRFERGGDYFDDDDWDDYDDGGRKKKR